jgi:hypothetical protein
MRAAAARSATQRRPACTQHKLYLWRGMALQADAAAPPRVYRRGLVWAQPPAPERHILVLGMASERLPVTAFSCGAGVHDTRYVRQLSIPADGGGGGVACRAQIIRQAGAACWGVGGAGPRLVFEVYRGGGGVVRRVFLEVRGADAAARARDLLRPGSVAHSVLTCTAGRLRVG